MNAKPACAASFAVALLTELGWSQVTCASTDAGYEVIIERAPEQRGLCRLSQRELSVLRLVADGLSSKEVGVELSIAPATSRGALDRAVKKLGLTGAGQVPVFWTALASRRSMSCLSDHRERFVFECALERRPLSQLTPSEQALASAVLLGESNLEIARRRNVSPRTIANQLHSIFRKLRVSSRGELAAALLRSRDAGDRSAELHSTNSAFTGCTSSG